MNNKFRLSLLAISLSTALLSGCSSQEEETTTPPTENAVPVIQFVGEKNIKINEREQAVLSYNVADSDDLESTLNVTYEVNGISESELEGDIVLDTSSKTLTYEVGDIQREINFSIVLNVTDPEGATASSSSINSRTATITVENSINAIPELEYSFEKGVSSQIDKDNVVQIKVAGNGDTLNGNNHVFNINLTPTDLDNDNLDINISNQNNIVGRFNKNTNVLEITTPQTYTEETKGGFTIVVDDSNEPLSTNFELTIEKTEVSPTLEVIKPQNSEGDTKFFVKESEFLNINYQVSDKNGDVVYVKAEETSKKMVGNLTEESSTGIITYDNFNINEQTEGYVQGENGKNGYVEVEVMFTATDRTGTAEVSETVTIVIEDDVKAELNSVNDAIELEINKYNSLNSREDELELFKFYSEYALLTNNMTKLQIESLKNQLETDRKKEEQEIESLLSVIQTAQNQDNPNFENLNSLLKDLESKVSSFGIQAIKIINNIAESSNGTLLLIDENTPIMKASNEEYSRYVGNTKYGFYSNVQEWKFLSNYEVFELVNFQGECK